MTTVIDERVVEMRFNNEDFERNVAQSMGTLDKLKEALKLDGATKSLEEIGSASKNFSLSGITETITEATNKFSLFEVAGISAIANITSKAVDFGLNFVKSLSLDQVSTGMDKYAEKTTAIQTIISATGASIDEVTEQIDKLNWFTDETSYNLTDMISNIAKFTNAGIGLSDAVPQMMGIAAAAGDAGKGVQGATHAMEGFSKAMSKQFMDSSSWQWIRTSGIDTIRFKEAMLEAAVATGTLKEAGDGLYQTLKGNLVTAEDFATNLKDRWLTAEAMQKGLETYGGFSNRLSQIMADLDFEGTTSDFLDMIDDYKNGILDIDDASKKLKVSSSELKEIMDELASDEMSIGEHAFKMSQEAKTFAEAIDSVKDAVSTGWMTTFEMIFGNYEEAKKLWTGLANDLWDAFASGGAERNEILKFWKELGGRNSLIEGAVNLINLFVKPLSTIKSAFKSMFPDVEGMGRVLYNLTERFRTFTEAIQPSEDTLRDIYQIFKGLFTIGKIIINIFTSIVKAIFPITRPFGSLLEMVIHFLGYIGAVITVLERFISQTNIVQVALSVLTTVFANLFNILKTIGLIVGGGLVTGITLFVNLIGKAVTAISTFISKSQFLTKIINGIASAFEKVKNFFLGFNKTTEGVTSVVKKMEESFGGANKVIAETGVVTNETAEGFKKATTPLERFISVLKTIGGFVAGAVGVVLAAVKAIGTGIFNFFKNVTTKFKELDANSTSFFDHIKALFTAFVDSLGSVGEKIKEIFESLLGDKVKGIADIFSKITEKVKEFTSSIDIGKIAAIAFAGAMLALVVNLSKIIKTVTETIGSVKGVFDTINKVIKGQFTKKSSVIMDLAKAFAIIAGSLALLVAVNKDGGLEEVSDAMFKLIIAFSACAAVLKGLDFLFAKFSKGIKAPLISTSVLALAGSMAILAGAMYVLNEINLKEDWVDKLKIMGLMLLELVAAAVLVSKFAPKLSRGSILLLAMALSMKAMADAMLKITGEDLSKVQDNLIGFSVVFGAMALMVAAAGQVKLSSALSLLLMAKALQIIFPQIIEAISAMDGNGTFSGIVDRVKGFIEKIKQFFIYIKETYGAIAAWAAGMVGVAGIVGAIWAFSKVIVAIGALGNLLRGVGIAVGGIGIGVFLLSASMEKLAAIKEKLSTEDFAQVAEVMKQFIIALGIAVGAVQFIGILSNVVAKKVLKADKLSANFATLAFAFVGIGASMILIAAALKIASTIDNDKLVAVGMVIGTLMLILAAVAGAAGTIKNGMTVMLSMVGIMTALAILLAEVAVVSIIIQHTDPGIIMGALGIISALMLLLATVLGAAGTVKKATPILAMAVLMIGSIAAVAAALYLLKDIPWDSLWPTVAAVGLLLGELALLGLAIGVVAKFFGKDINGATVALMATSIGALLIIAGVLKDLHGITWKQFGPTIAAVGLVMAELAALMAIVGVVSKFLVKGNGESALILMAGSILSLATIGTVLGLLHKIKWEEYIPTLKAVSAIMGMMALLIAVTAAAVGLGVKRNWASALALMGGAIVSLIAVGAALYALKDIPWESLKGPMMAVCAVMGTMTGLIAVVGGITRLLDNWKRIGGALALMVGAIVSLSAVGWALVELAKIPAEDLAKARDNMALMLLALSGITAVMSLLTALVGAIAGIFGAGAAGFFAVPAALLSMAAAILATGAAFLIASYAVTVLADGLAKLYDPLLQLSTLDLPGIAFGLGALGVACIGLGVGLGVFGIGAGIGAAGFALLGLALNVFNSSAQAAIPIMQQLQAMDLGGIGLGFAEMGAGGLALIPGAAGVYVFAKAIEYLASALEKMDGKESFIGNFFTDAGNAISNGAGKIKGIADSAGQAVAGAFEKGWRMILGWFSPPKIVVDFFADMGYALSDNYQLINIADGSAVSIGSAFKDGFMGSLSGLAEQFQGYLSGMLGMASNFMYKIRGILNFSGAEISQFGANGMPTDVINKMYGGTATASKFSDMLQEQLTSLTDFHGLIDKDNYILDEFTESLGGATEGLGGLGEGFDEAGEKAGKAGKSVKEFGDSLKDTLAGQLDMFTKFEIKTGVTADQMIENMRSNIDGFASWSHRMTVLAERFAEHGISETLYEKLAELGPKGYETMNAFYEMTDEQLEEVRGLWETGLTLPEGQADIVASGFQYMGEMSVQGFSDALDEHKAAHAASQFGKSALAGLAKALAVASPSKETFKIGVFAAEGLGKGLTSDTSKAFLDLCVGQISEYILQLFDENFSEEVMSEAGTGILTNLFTGLLGEATEENPVMAAFIQTFTDFELIDEALTEFVEHIKQFLYELFEIPGDEEPSEWFIRFVQTWIMAMVQSLSQFWEEPLKEAVQTFVQNIKDTIDEADLPQHAYDVGMNIALGLKRGIEEYAEQAIEAATTMVTTIMEIMSEVPMVQSPSKVTMRIGRYISEGLAIGIEDGAENVYDAARSVSEEGISGIESNIGRLQDVINEGLDFNPVITPMLDLSLIRDQVSELDSLMNDPSYGLTGQNEGNSLGGKASQINFTQNNYSPKALTRYEIYRQTRNQLSMIKGAMR